MESSDPCDVFNAYAPDPIPDDADRNTAIDNAGDPTTQDWVVALVPFALALVAVGALLRWSIETVGL